MANKIACTNCDRAVAAALPVGWLECHRLGPAAKAGYPEPSGRFCSDSCLIEWFQNGRRDRETARPPPPDVPPRNVLDLPVWPGRPVVPVEAPLPPGDDGEPL